MDTVYFPDTSSIRNLHAMARRPLLLVLSMFISLALLVPSRAGEPNKQEANGDDFDEFEFDFEEDEDSEDSGMRIIKNKLNTKDHYCIACLVCWGQETRAMKRMESLMM